MAQSQTPRRKLERGRYIVIDACSGMVLDLSGADDRTLIAFGLHGGANQQWEFLPCGPGFIINSVKSSDLFLTLQDLKRLYLEGSAQLVTGTFPTCWEVEVMDNGSSCESENEPEHGRDVYVRIRLPQSDEKVLGFKELYEGAPPFLSKEGPDVGTYRRWWLRPLARRRSEEERVVENAPIAMSETVVRAGGVTTTVTTTTTTTSLNVTTTTKTVTRIVPGDV